jgi:hypothetical protein
MAVDLTVLSVRQPWAALMLTGDKWCENRSWPTDYRGPLWIHASQSFSEKERAYWQKQGIDAKLLVPGAILGCVDLVEVLDVGEITAAREEELIEQYQLDPAGHEHVEGEWCWIVARPRALPQPIPATGKLRLWKFSADDSAVAGLPTTARVMAKLDDETLAKRRASRAKWTPQTLEIVVDGNPERVKFSPERQGVAMWFLKRSTSRYARRADAWQYDEGEPYFRAGCEKAWEVFPDSFLEPTPEKFLARRKRKSKPTTKTTARNR